MNNGRLRWRWTVACLKGASLATAILAIAFEDYWAIIAAYVLLLIAERLSYYKVWK